MKQSNKLQHGKQTIHNYGSCIDQNENKILVKKWEITIQTVITIIEDPERNALP